MPLALAQQHGMGYTEPGTWRHSARDWRSGRVVFPHTTPDGRLVHLYGRAVETKEQVPKAKRHDHPRTPRPPARQRGRLASPAWSHSARDGVQILSVAC
jgi:hypothetical protein